MENDYYQILEVSKSSSEDEIKKSYKKLALKYHPDKNKTAGAEERFKKITEAYDVLTDRKKRNIYDTSRNNDHKGQGNSTCNDNSGTEFNFGLFTIINGQSQVYFNFPSGVRTFVDHLNITNQDPAIEYNLYLSLAEQIGGCTKKVKISRWVPQANGTNRKEEKELIINVKPGSRIGTRFVFEKEGDRRMNKVPSDIVFTVRDK